MVSEQLLGLGVDVAHHRLRRPARRPHQLAAVPRRRSVDLIVTTGGLGPTADDLTVPTVAAFCGRELQHDPTSNRITDILLRWRGIDGPARSRRGGRSASVCARDAGTFPPTGAAPGSPSLVPMAPAIIVLPPTSRTAGVWPAAVITDAFASVTASLPVFSSETIRVPAVGGRTGRDFAAGRCAMWPGFRHWITTCIRAGEIDMVTRFADDGRSPMPSFSI